MSSDGENSSIADHDENDHQPAYIFSLPSNQDAPEPPPKRRKVGRGKRPSAIETSEAETLFKFEPLFDGLENPECAALRQHLFEQCWGQTEKRIQDILGHANNDTLLNVTSFVQETGIPGVGARVPTGFICTGPNISSQSLLFKQLSSRLGTYINGPVVNLRSGDASNLKAVLKQIIRDATNQKSSDDDEYMSVEKDGRKALNYDLGILHSYVKAHGCEKVIIAFQDSEAFDPAMLADLIILFNSWMDRIPFALLFGIATSVQLFHERLARAASRCLYGTQFDVEQTSAILEEVFEKVIAGLDAPLRLGPGILSSIVERQNDHVQSVQAFTAALKFAYMGHFYANPLAILNDCKMPPETPVERLVDLLQPQHLEAVRLLPSFRRLVEDLVKENKSTHARALLADDESLKDEISTTLQSGPRELTIFLLRLQLLSVASTGPISKIELYLRALRGTLNDSEPVRTVLDSIKRMAPDAVIDFIKQILVAKQDSEISVPTEELPFFKQLAKFQKEAKTIANEAKASGTPVRSSYAMHNSSLRTTVIAQKVQLSYEKSSLSKDDINFTGLVDRLVAVLKHYFTFENPQNWFLSEVWLYDAVSPYQDVFAPRPRFSVERALSMPSDYLPNCDPSVDALPYAKPATAIVYQMYLESGSLVNISDIWEAFLSHVGGDDGEGYDERTSLMLLYRSLADLKLLGMIKQSRKKADHLAKSAWKGL